MNDDKKREIAEAILEKRKRLEENRIKYYVPHPKQKAFHTSLARDRWAFTGNRFGKTCMAAVEAIWHLTGEYPEWYPEEGKSPVPCRGRVICTDFINGIEKVSLPEIKKWMPKRYLINGSWEQSYSKLMRKLTLTNGSSLEFMSFDQDLGSFAGTSLHFIWQDEHGKRDIYRENKMRLIDTSGRFWGTLTPVKGISYEYDEIYEKRNERDDLEIFRAATMDNALLSNEEVEEMTKDLSEDEKRIRLHGDFVFLTGLIYKEWDRNIHLCEPFDIPKSWTRYCAIDPHTRTPTAVLYWAVSPDDDHYIYDELYLPDMQVSEMARYMLAKENRIKVETRFIDPAAKAVNSAAGGFNFINEFVEHDIYTTIADNRLTEGIQALRELLKPKFSVILKKAVPKLRVFNTCKQFAKEIEHYRWPEYKPEGNQNIKEKPVKKDVHLPDCARYIAISKPEYVDMEKVRQEPQYSKEDNLLGGQHSRRSNQSPFSSNGELNIRYY